MMVIDLFKVMFGMLFRQTGKSVRRLSVALALVLVLLISSTAFADLAKNFGGLAPTGSSTGQATAVDASGNVYITGNFNAAYFQLGNVTLTRIGTQDTFVAKMDTSGNVLWAKNFGGSGATAAIYGLVVDGTGNVYLSGYLNGASLTTPALTKIGTYDAFAIKLDSTGATTWAKNYGGSGANAYGNGIAVDGSGNVYVGVTYELASLTNPSITKIGVQDSLVIKLDSTGAFTWANNFGEAGASMPCAGIAADGSGNVYLTGVLTASITTPALTKIGAVDAYAIKLDPTGATTWAKNFGGSSAYVYMKSIAVDGSGNVYLGGLFYTGNLSNPVLTRIGTQDALAIMLNSDGTTNWAKNFGGNLATAYARCIAVDSTGNVYLGGDFINANLTTPALPRTGGGDSYAIKLNSSGTITWSKHYGGTSTTAYGTGIAVDGVGNVFLGGYFGSQNLTIPAVTKLSSQDVLLIKLDSAGTTTWAKNYAGAAAGGYATVSATAVDASGNIYISGNFNNIAFKLGNVTLGKIGSWCDAFVAKLDASGTVLWAKNFGGAGANAYAPAITVDSSGNVYLGGYFVNASLTTPALPLLGTNTAYAIKLDSSGATLWAKNFGAAAANAYVYGVAVDSSDNVYLGGTFTASLTTPVLTKIGTQDVFALKLDSTGAAVWQKGFGGSGATAGCQGIRVDGSGIMYLSGYFSGANLTTPGLTRIGTQDAFAFKLNADGTVNWAKNYGGSGATVGAPGIAVDGSGNVYLGGNFNASLTTPALTKIGTQDAYALKLDSTGATTWSHNYGGSGATVTGAGIAVDASGNVDLAGYFTGSNLTTPALTRIGWSSYTDILAIRLDATGTTTWSKNYGGNAGARAYCYSIAADNSGNIYLGGYFDLYHLSTPVLNLIGSQDALLIGSFVSHSVTYNGNGSTGGSVPVDASSPYSPGSTVTVLSNTGSLVKTGYLFNGWNTAANGSGTSYTAGATFTVINAPIILYAQWAPTYTVTYNGNGYTGGTVPTDASSPYLPGATVTVKSNTGTLVKNGSTFNGWNTAANGSGTSYTASGSETFTMGAANVVLYAQWGYLVTYWGNSNTGGTVPTDAVHPAGATVTILANTGNLTRTSYNFTGWNTAANGGGTSYAPGATFVPAVNTWLYAKWTGTVTYDGNGNTGGAAPTDATGYLPGATVTALTNSGALTRTGFTFNGWNTAANGSGTNYVAGSGTFAMSGNVTLYARWTATVTYNGNGNTGGAVPTDGTAYLPGATVTVRANTGNLVKTSSTFVGWNTAADGSGTSYAASGSATFTMAGSTTLYAQWTAAVTYNGNSNTGGTVPIDTSSPYSPGSTVTVLGNTGSLVRTGYSFVGWNTAANGAGTSYAAGATFTISTPVTLYAQWSPTYTVTYNDNGATGGTVPTDVSSPYIPGATVTVQANTGSLVKNAYTFAGWNTAANGSGTSYAPAATFTMGAANVVLYAQWGAYVHYNGNGSTGGAPPTDATVYMPGAMVTVLANTGSLTRTGYTFAGWNTQANFGGTNYAPDATFAVSINTMLYAKWTGAVTYDGNGNTGGAAPTDATAYLSGATVTALANSGALTRTGFAFNGWNTAADGSGTSYAAGSGSFTMSGNVTLYAKWMASVAYNGNGNTSGTVPTDGTLYLPGATVTVRANTGTLAKTGCTFIGWNTAANGSGTSYAATGTATFAMAGNTTLYAQWTATVTYNGNGNTSGTVPTDANSPYLSGSTVTVLGNTGSLVNTGYGFAGWSTVANGGTLYAPGATFTITANTTLYARWVLTPTVTLINPSNGPAAGGTSVAIGGTNFTGATAVTFGGVAAGFTVNADNSISATTPAGSGVNLAVVVTTPGGTSSPSHYFSYNAPSVASISPASGIADGGTGVTIIGLNFTGVTAVKFGGTDAAGFAFQSDTEITATAPAGSVGIVDITVISASGTSATGAGDRFTYTVPTYSVTYNGNGATGGSVPMDGSNPYVTGSTVTVRDNSGTLVKTGGAFNGWNTAANGSGTRYVAGATFAIAANTTLYAQWSAAIPAWADVFGTAASNSLVGGTVTDSSGNVYITGQFDGPTLTVGGVTLTRTGVQDVFVAELDATGTVIWATNIGGGSGTTTSAQDLAVDGAGNVYLNGNFSGGDLTNPPLPLTGTQDVFAIKLDGSGAVTWAKDFGGSGATTVGSSIAVDGSGNVYLEGTFNSASLSNPALPLTGNQDVFAIKLDVSGDTTWAKDFGGSGVVANGSNIVVDGAGNVYLGGDFSGGALTTPALTLTGTQDAFAIKLDDSGDTTWAKDFGGSGAAADVSSIAVDGGGNVYLAGTMTGTLTTLALTALGTVDALLMKLDSSGSVTAAKNFGGSGATASIGGITFDSSGNVYLGGGFSGAPLTSPALGAIGTSDALLMGGNLLAPTITSITPGNGPAAGGTSVTITGTNFTGATGVTIGGVAVTNFTVDSSTSITATTPSGSGLNLTVAVTTANGTSSTVGLFNYNGPSVTSISPTSGTADGGTSVTITGLNFSDATAVKFGSTNASGFAVHSDTEITATAPAGSVGVVDISIITPSGTSATGGGSHFTYTVPTYTVTYDGNADTGGSVPTDSSSPYNSGSTVTVLGNTGSLVRTGYGFAGWNTVANGSGTTYEGGETFTITSATTLYAKWVAIPTITSITPGNGPAVGGTSVTITGTNFTGATAVTIGGVAVTSFAVDSSTSISATTPSGSGVNLTVAVTTAGGTSSSVISFNYDGPSITAISPTSGTILGGTPVTITGSNFTGATAVTIDGTSCTGITVSDDTTIIATTPAGTLGLKSVAVITPSGTGTGINLFTYTTNNLNEAPVFTGTPAISGNPLPGQILGLVNTGTSDPDGDPVTLSYQWRANGGDIGGATNATYQLTVSELGKSVSCVLIANDGQGQPNSTATVTTAGVIVQPDSDGDGVADSVDNCPSVYNPNQKDANGNGVGDACDYSSDSDNDGVSDAQEVLNGTDPLVSDNGSFNLSSDYHSGLFRDTSVATGGSFSSQRQDIGFTGNVIGSYQVVAISSGASGQSGAFRLLPNPDHSFSVATTDESGITSNDQNLMVMADLSKVDNTLGLQVAGKKGSGMGFASLAGNYVFSQLANTTVSHAAPTPATRRLALSFSGSGGGSYSLLADSRGATGSGNLGYLVQDDGAMNMLGGAGFVTPDGEVIVSVDTTVDADPTVDDEISLGVGVRQGSALNNASLKGDFIYYELGYELHSWTARHHYRFDGQGHGRYYVGDDSEGQVLPPLRSTFAYTVDSNGSVSLDGRSVGVLSANGQYLVFADTDSGASDAYPGISLGIGVKTANSLRAKLGCYWQSNWYQDGNESGRWEWGSDAYGYFGSPGMTPVAGDWTGDGHTKVGAYINGTWYLDLNDNGLWDGEPTDRMITTFGYAGAIPVTGDWNGDGVTEIGVYDPNSFTWYLDYNGNFVYDPGIDIAGSFGFSGCLPVVGDWNGNGHDKIGVYYQGQWYLDLNGNFAWDGSPTDTMVANYGFPGMVPLAGDWNGSGVARIGGYYNGDWYLDIDGNGEWNPPIDRYLGPFGSSGMVPVVGHW